MLLKILIGIAGVLVLFAAVVATRPAAYRVERALEVAAPTDLVFGVLNDLHQFAGAVVLFGTPLREADPDLQETFEGPPAGVGQSYAWQGKEAGKGSLTIEESVPGREVRMKLEFVEPMKSTADCVLTVSATPTGSAVTWSMAGKHNFLGKALGIFMNMDTMLGTDIELGLARLKSMTEKAAAPAAAPPG